jgi:hypothetical protein
VNRFRRLSHTMCIVSTMLFGYRNKGLAPLRGADFKAVPYGCGCLLFDSNDVLHYFTHRPEGILSPLWAPQSNNPRATTPGEREA